jgi:hypothetical protein
VRVSLFGATGMVGQGVLHECVLAAHVESMLAIGGSAVLEAGNISALTADEHA